MHDTRSGDDGDSTVNMQMQLIEDGIDLESKIPQVTPERQIQAIRVLTEARAYGVTWYELSEKNGWHHGQSSGVLSTLHRLGKVARLKQRRDKCHIYVLPEFALGAETQPYGRQTVDLRAAEREDIIDRLEMALGYYAATEPEMARGILVAKRIVEGTKHV